MPTNQESEFLDSKKKFLKVVSTTFLLVCFVEF